MNQSNHAAMRKRYPLPSKLAVFLRHLTMGDASCRTIRDTAIGNGLIPVTSDKFWARSFAKRALDHGYVETTGKRDPYKHGGRIYQITALGRQAVEDHDALIDEERHAYRK